MKINSFHGEFSRTVNFQSFVSKLAESSGYLPLFQEDTKRLEKRLAPLGFPVENLGFSDWRREILLASDSSSAVLIRVNYPSSLKVAIAGLDVLAVCAKEIPDIPGIFKEALGISLNPGSSASAWKVKHLEERLGKLSQHGKMLADPDIGTAVRRLQDDALRKDLAMIVNAVGDTPVPKQYLARMEQFKGRGEKLNGILNDGSLVHKQFVVTCNHCKLQQLAFPGQSQAKIVLGDAVGKCLNCREGRLGIEENYAVAGNFLEGVRQGLWLESLVSEVMRERASKVWTGHRVGDDDFDILSFFLDRTILIECADFTFGQNDLYKTAIKAQTFEADSVIIISTRKILPNVRNDTNHLQKVIGESRNYLLISEDSCDAIRASLTSELDRMQEEYINNWLNGGGVHNFFDLWNDNASKGVMLKAS